MEASFSTMRLSTRQLCPAPYQSLSGSGNFALPIFSRSFASASNRGSNAIAAAARWLACTGPTPGRALIHGS